MKTKFSKLFSILLVVGLLTSFGVLPALAADATGAPGDGPANAVSPVSGAVQIAPGQWQWYVFRSQLPVNVEESDENAVTNPADATVDAALQIYSGNVDFEVWSPNDLNNWRDNVDFTPMGQGTVNEFMNGDPLFWQGSFKANNNYYLIVMNRTNQPAYYSLSITGDVALPSALTLNSNMQSTATAQTSANQGTPQEPAMSTGEMALTVETPATTTATTSSNAAPSNTASTAELATGPSTAVAPASGSVRIGPGQWQWYVFHSQVPFTKVDTTEDVVTNPNDATVDAALRTSSGSVDFQVWSSNDLNNWRDNVDFTPMGKGTVNDFMSGDPLFWQGSFRTNSDYYLIVMNRTDQPAFYTLNITGDVSFPTTTTLPVN
ncbi:MAG: hypothetical protein R3C14_09105 [Caldilineaceae bacterium]